MMQERAGRGVGIDLGTTYSSLSYVDRNLIPRVVQDAYGNAVVPSVIYFDDAGVIVGDLAVQQSTFDVERVVQFVKVHMGDRWERLHQGHVYTPESLSALILRSLAREAEPQIGPIREAVITVPAYFSERRRLATQQAGEIAGLTVKATLDEPMAATLAYGLHRQDKEQIVVVYDLGGGTFDVAVVRISPEEIEELAINGNRQLGGRDWDQQLIEFVVEDFRRAFQADPTEDALAMQNLRLECDLAKRRLSQMMRTSIPFHFRGRDHVAEVTRQKFEELTAGLLHTTRVTTEIALDDAGLEWSQISRVVLTGLEPDVGVNPVLAVALGAAIYAHMLETDVAPYTTRGSSTDEEQQESESTEYVAPEPLVEQVQTVRESEPLLEIEPEDVDSIEVVTTEGSTSLEPKGVSEATASGVGNAALLSPWSDTEQPLPSIHFVTAHGVGVRARAGEDWKNVVLIPRNTPVPASATKRFVTASEAGGGTHVKVEVTQGDTVDPDLAELLGTGRIEGFGRHVPPGQPVDVVMMFDAEGRLHTKAIYVNTGQEMQLSLEVPEGLRPQEVEEQKRHLDGTVFLSVFDPDDTLAQRNQEGAEDEMPGDDLIPPIDLEW